MKPDITIKVKIPLCPDGNTAQDKCFITASISATLDNERTLCTALTAQSFSVHGSVLVSHCTPSFIDVAAVTIVQKSRKREVCAGSETKVRFDAKGCRADSLIGSQIKIGDTIVRCAVATAMTIMCSAITDCMSATRTLSHPCALHCMYQVCTTADPQTDTCVGKLVTVTVPCDAGPGPIDVEVRYLPCATTRRRVGII